MNIEQHLIFIKGEDKTNQINYCKFENTKYHITFDNNKTYEYNFQNVVWMRNPVEMDSGNHVIYKNGQPIIGVNKILIFKYYCRIIYNNNFTELYRLSEIEIKKSALVDQKSTDCINYFKQVSNQLSVKDERDSSFLMKQYDKMTFINPDSVMAKYISNEKMTKENKINDIIFPFGFNISQKRATEQALKHQLSVIEGPPGTGKTQTILNIIANAVCNNKTVAVVSNNNSAISNVIEKLEKYGLDFICAYLGSNANKQQFFNNQLGVYPNLEEWSRLSHKNDVMKLQRELNRMLESRNRLAQIMQELKSLRTEYNYFKVFLLSVDKDLPVLNKFKHNNSDKVLDLILDLKYIMSKKKVSFLQKLNLMMSYGYRNARLVLQYQDLVIISLQNIYYKQLLNELENQQKELNKQLKDLDFNHKMKQYTEISLDHFKHNLAKRYKKQKKRVVFNDKALWKDFDHFIEEYPVILSTTHSLRNSVKQDYQFDYLIMDEASQVDLVSGGLALSCAKNAIIVGDTKQLPNVIPTNIMNELNKTFSGYQLKDGYNVASYSLLASILKLYPEIPKTLLKEHYRCHPQIINFCNQKFYNNELVILTEDNETINPLSLYVTVEGNHARGNYNQRQIDVITKEVLPKYNGNNASSIGIISPYRRHAEEIQRVIEEPNIEADTVHKFQGREKDVIILSTVANEVNNFIDDPNLINVAVSRAVNHLIVVVANGFEHRRGTNIGDLIRYIKYNNYEVVESQVYSAFDLLYSNYSKKLLTKFKNVKKVSDYQSENLMNVIIENVLNREEFRCLGKIMHQPLRMLIKDSSKLTADEYKYAMNILTHTDFLIYSKVDKSPILVIEVDGYAYHDQNPTQLRRDRLKDQILEKYNIPILRLKTNESGEEERVVEQLRKVLHLK
jgi:superfamily I DNA and/or RNA helicase